MATVSIPYTFVNGGTQNADATQVNSNFSTLASFLNTEVIQRDASVAFTQIPTLPSTTPTNANHATRKGYVDSFFPVTSANIANDSIINEDIKSNAAIAYSKLNLAASIVAADFAAAAKPTVICTSAARPSTPVEGQLAYETDTNRVIVWDSAAWRYVRPVTDTFTITFAGASSITGTVTFPVTFGALPIVTTDCAAITGNTAVVLNVTARTTTSFTYRAYNATGGTYTGSITGFYVAVDNF